MIRVNYNEIFEYRDGRLFWKVRRSSNAGIGREAGSIKTCNRGGKQYRGVKINGKFILVHRLIHEMHFGPIPTGVEIDHIDSDSLNNLIDNLRLATRGENAKNRKANSNSTSGLKGVSWIKQRRKWMAHIKVDGRHKHLGYFNTREEAHAAYCLAAKEFHGDFHRVA